MSFYPTGGNVYLNEEITVKWPYSSDLGKHILLQIWYDEGDYIGALGGGPLSNSAPQGSYNWTPINYTPGQYYSLNTANLNSTLRQNFPGPIWLTTRASSSTSPTSLATTAGTTSTYPAAHHTHVNKTPSPSPSSHKDEGHSVIGPAVGGSIGGVAVLAILGFLLYFFARRRSRRKAASHVESEKMSSQEVSGLPEEKRWQGERVELENSRGNERAELGNSHGTSELPARPMASVELPGQSARRK